VKRSALNLADNEEEKGESSSMDQLDPETEREVRMIPEEVHATPAPTTMFEKLSYYNPFGQR